MAKISVQDTCYCGSSFVVVAAGGYLTAAVVLFSSDKIETVTNQNCIMLVSQFRLTNYTIS